MVADNLVNIEAIVELPQKMGLSAPDTSLATEAIIHSVSYSSSPFAEDEAEPLNLNPSHRGQHL